jgi:hypothetical protein
VTFMPFPTAIKRSKNAFVPGLNAHVFSLQLLDAIYNHGPLASIGTVGWLSAPINS